MIPYLPHSEAEIEAMLKKIGVSSIEDLFSDVPEAVRFSKPLNMPDSMAEADVFSEMGRMAEMNKTKLLFTGGGQYDHAIPSVVPHLTGRSEFVTAYTPYQPEMSQGILQVLFEFQSAIAEITGLPVSNASLYDGHTAASEACTMALNARRKAHIMLVAGTIHPHTWTVLNSYFGDLDVELVKLQETAGRVELKTLTAALEKDGDKVAGVLVQTPNFYGALEDLSGWGDAVHEAGAKLIISAHPLSLGVLTSPAEWGADIAIGDTQPLGLPPYFGGPSAGYIACDKSMMRRMPGRIVGETTDADGKRAFVLTLQAREQHIKRERATSNICSNQSLAALANTIYMVAIGPGGFSEVSERNLNAAASLRVRLTGDLKLEDYSGGAVFNEFTVKIPVSREKWLAPFEAAGIAPGFFPNNLDSSLPENLFTIAVTEKRTAAELERYIECAREALG
ncbi:MAG: aminomethyl-transferring glycine dehydrogenase subunit GcvPA [Spirochaetes bacterium]|nr:MAG: aminomethyl-transferring glycine dehydrogenase subunit GcvPA [Spirochaetota bacterium]